MAEIVVSAAITVLCEKLISGDLLKLARSEGIDSKLQKWKTTLPMIQAVLADAAQKQIKESSVRLWLNDLQDLAYDIDDVLDDLATEALRRKLNQESHASTSTSQILKFIPTCCTNFTPRQIRYGRQMSSKLDEITTTMDDLVDRKNKLSLNVNVNAETSKATEGWSEQTSLVQLSKIIGRGGDKEAMLGKLLGNEACDENVSVVPIVGMGGIGKTTLAKVLYNDDKVKNQFEVRAWVCVSEELDVVNISKAILEAVGGEDKGFSRLEPIHQAIKEKLANKRFLLVLDDVWNEDQGKWKSLKSPLLDGAPGSRIMVTTRSTKVASVMAFDEPHRLEVLSDEDALSLFAQHSLGEINFDKHPTLKSIGENIVKKCGKLPLALETLGTALRRNRDGDKWKELLNSEEWDIQSGSGIIPALRISYNHLPPHLKRVFAYCSLFPKDYVFHKKKLALLWMAEGFLPQSNCNKSMESIGHTYFDELESRSFFQYSLNGGDSEDIGYTMHDLISDLATSVAIDFFYRLDEEMDGSNKNVTVEKLRHFSLIGQECGSYRKLTELQAARRVRTFLRMSGGREGGWYNYASLDNALAELIPQLLYLRVLSLACQNITQVPQPIGNLKHLRYLNFSHTGITCLPEEVSDLYNLQSLLVRGCRELSNLPENFGKLINLRHLDTTDTPKLNKMPSGIGELTSLQTLSKVIIAGGNGGFNISELKGLSDLKGELFIMGLEKVIDPVQAKDANLHQKKGLDVLKMKWSNEFVDSRDERTAYEVLEALKPHDKLKTLHISLYKGATFPSWVGDPSFSQLTELRLGGCTSPHFPTFGHLQSLKKLYVEGMDGVKTLDFASHGITFPSLEYLEFDDMKCWQRWSTVGGDGDAYFPRLHEIHIIFCPKLESYNCPNSVERLEISQCDSMTSLTFSTVQELPSTLTDSDNIRPAPEKGTGLLPVFRLTSLEIRYCKNLKSFPHEHFQSFTYLERLSIFGCPSMDSSFPCGLWPPNLRILEIGRLKKPMSEWGFQNYPTSLVHLSLYGDDSGVVSFAVAEDERNATASSSFLLPPSLTSLTLQFFPEVESLSDVLPHLPCLKRLHIFRCPKIEDQLETMSVPSSLEVRKGLF